MPFSNLVFFTGKNVPRLIVGNKKPDIFAGEDEKNNIYVIGDCNEKTKEIMENLDWK